MKDFVGEVVIVGNGLRWVRYLVGLHGCDKLDQPKVVAIAYNWVGGLSGEIIGCLEVFFTKNHCR